MFRDRHPDSEPVDQLKIGVSRAVDGIRAVQDGLFDVFHIGMPAGYEPMIVDPLNADHMFADFKADFGDMYPDVFNRESYEV